MSEFFRPEQSRTENVEDIEKHLSGIMFQIKSTQVFNDAYLDEARLVIFKEDNPLYIYEKGKVEKIEANPERYSIDGFTSGIETSYAVLSTKEEYDAFKVENLKDYQFVQTLFYDAKFSYGEFVAHEMGHNVFDLAYDKKEGELEVFDFIDEDGNKDGENTDLSAEYKNKIKIKLERLFSEYGMDGVLDKFVLQRQKIAEIFAILMQREFSKRSGEFAKSSHSGVTIEKVKEILSDVEGKITEINKKTGRNISVEDFFTENHVLSLIAAPILESEYPDFDKRMEFFEL